MKDEPKRPVVAECECGHQWVVAYLPMELKKFCRITRRAHCPMCGNGSDKIAVHEPRVSGEKS